MNPNILYARLFVNSLVTAGLKSVVISPGSRSTPLTLAFEAHPQIKTFLHIDERGAGFYALGMALASEKPVALVCTSGTAVSNYLPAIVEAQMSQVPLLILTGDRPHELRHSGANQTIDQVKIFGDQVLWSVDMPIPQADAPEIALRHVQTTAVRAYTTANGLRKGPVHVNFPFRKPLEPAAEEIRDWRLETKSTSTISSLQSPVSIGILTPLNEQLNWLTAVLTQHPRGLIICGPRCPGGDFPAVVTTLSKQTGYPLLADPLSGMRFFNRRVRGERRDFEEGQQSVKSAKSVDSFLISGYETFMQQNIGWPEPEVIVRFGQVPTSKWLNAYLDKINPAIRLHIRENGVWADDSQRTTHFWQLNETAVCQTLTTRLQNHQPDPAWQQTIRATEQATWDTLQAQLAQHWFDGAAIATLLEMLAEDANLLIGNSLPVRHLDQYDHGFCPSTDFDLREIQRFTFMVEADAQAIATYYAWMLRQAGRAEAWDAIARLKEYADIGDVFADSIARGDAPVVAVGAAFDAWFTSPWRVETYRMSSCTAYLDRLDDSKRIRSYALLPEDYFTPLCRLPDGMPYPCAAPE